MFTYAFRSHVSALYRYEKRMHVLRNFSAFHVPLHTQDIQKPIRWFKINDDYTRIVNVYACSYMYHSIIEDIFYLLVVGLTTGSLQLKKNFGGKPQC